MRRCNAKSPDQESAPLEIIEAVPPWHGLLGLLSVRGLPKSTAVRTTGQTSPGFSVGFTRPVNEIRPRYFRCPGERFWANTRIMHDFSTGSLVGMRRRAPVSIFFFFLFCWDAYSNLIREREVRD